MEKTYFSTIYRYFYSKITDDMYMELDETQTEGLLEELLLNALPHFEFPRFNLYNYDLRERAFLCTLSNEEMHIIATYMVVGWIDQQLASVELVRMKYSGSDFRFTSQANHIGKLQKLRQEFERIGFHLQRLYKRRKRDADGIYRSTFGQIMASSVKTGAPAVHQFKEPPAEPIPASIQKDGNDEIWVDLDTLRKPPVQGGWEDMQYPSQQPVEEEGWINMEDIPTDTPDLYKSSGGWHDM